MFRPDIIIFGPQRTFPKPESLARLRLVLLTEPCLTKFLAAIKDLPKLWSSLLKARPALERVPGIQVLEDLKTWVERGHLARPPNPLPNTLLTPLSVVADVVHYLHFVRLREVESGESHADIISNIKSCGLQGFGVGTLAALALACSKDQRDLGVFGSVALRLAVCIGALVDLESVFSDPANEVCSLDVCLESAKRPQVLHILERFPETYVSTQKDDACITVTASKTTLPLLMAQLSASGATAIPIPLRGRFHSKKNEEALATMLDLCASHSNLQYPPIQNLAVPVSTDINPNDGGSLHEIASRSILVGQSNWSLAIASATSQVSQPNGVHILAIGDLNSLHWSTEKEIVVRATYLRDFELSECPKPSSTASRWSHVEERHLVAPYTRDTSENDIAIIGMACRFPGAGSIEEFWQLLCEGISMHQEIPIQRFSMHNPRMTTGGEVKFWGNFLTDADAFDHIFFGISSREAASMDPQQRILLQLAYQALESSWYFDEVPKPHDVGCFLGVGAVEYEGNVASHPPTAFSALGTLRAFVSGKISHRFGWTGPSITYDTACSSSAVAIHSACQALQLGECSSALAGGVNMMTSTAMYQNLGKAGFLSPTGPCKAFDGKADGYCRGEGAGLVVLKRLSTAIADGDPIAAIIAGSAVSQSENCTPITVPNSASQINLYRKVTSMAGVDPTNVSFVEAHGTGTIVGDPVECESIRQVFGGRERSDTLYFGSVKANIGHTEAASGVAALIKAVLMINKETVPMQANFRKLNPQISPLRPDKMDISAETQQWKGSAVCLNNYGAAGSISALVVCRDPARPSSREIDEDTEQRRPPKNPIHLSAHSINSLRAKCMALRQYLVTKTTTCSGETDIESVAFNLAHAADHSLPTFTTVTATSLSELCSDLSTLGSGRSEFQTRNHVAERAVVLCFGGQTKDFIGMSKDVYQRVSILRLHLDHCNSVCQSLGVRPLLPAIFRKTPIDDLQLLHCLLFSLQYACARSWIECGLRVDALIGHSFGQLTALCVSGSISLEEAMRLIAGRATLMQKLWGSDRGTMIAIESDFENVSHILSLAWESEKSTRAEIACFNSPTSHVVAGTQRSIKAVEDIIALRQKSSPSLKSKRLGVTHAFHSHLADSIVPGLTELAHTVRFLKPKIPVEMCTRKQSWDPVEAKDIARYSREPVYFSQAVRRIETRLGPCAWLEAGSDSPITIMASHALEPSVRAKHAFQPVSLASADARDLLAEATVDLWKLGLKVQFWPYHRVQRHYFSQLNLPPYQFETPRHWLENAVSPVPRTQALERGLGLASPILSLISFVRPQNEGRSIAEFQIDPESQQFKSYLKGHKVLGNSLCPASLYAHLATRAASAVSENGAISSENFRLEDLQFQTPLGLNNEHVISLFLRVTDDCPDRFSFEFCSRQYEDTFQQLIHATGALYIEQTESARLEIEFARYERIASSRRLQLLAHNGSESSIAGGFIYKVFSSVVDYAEYFRGVERIASSGWEVAGRIMIPEPPTDLLDGGIWEPLLIDNFLQLAGLHINCLQGREQSKVHVCTRIGKLQPSLELRGWKRGPWEAFSRLEALEGGEVSSNIFVIDPRTEALVFTILGARFTEVSITSLAKTLSRTDSCERHPTASPGKPHATPAGSDASAELYRRLDSKALEHPLPQNGGDDAFFEAVRQMLSRVTDVPIQDMKYHSRLEAIGVDSLMTVEVMEEIEKVFRVSIPMSEFQELTDLESLCLRIGVTKPPGSQSLEPLERTTTHYKASPNENSDPDGIQESRQDETDQAIRTTSTTSSIKPPIEQILAALHEVQGGFDSFANEANFGGFLQRVHPRQFELTVAYVAEAFDKLGCSLLRLREGEVLPDLPCLPKHKKLVAQLHEILAKAGLIRFQSTANVRTAEPISETPAHVLYGTMLDDFPQHFSEHRLLGYMGSLLAECLSGKMEAVHLMFGHQENRDLLEDVYSNAPAFATGSKVLISFLSKLLTTKSTSKPVQILEVGAGTGATSIRVVELLRAQNIPYNYTFTDISSSLVANARKRFADDASMSFAVLDIENDPPEYLLCSQDIIVSTNAIHATKSLAHSSANMRKMLRANGILCLVELTRRLYWFDIVFGLLEGWWLFEDSRTHAIAHESFWKQCLLEAGFALVDWSTGGMKESNEIRLIVALSGNVATEGHALEGQPEIKMETLMFKQIGRIPLYADIYYPRNILARKSRLAVALMIHGGGNIMLSRKDIRPMQTQLLLDQGLLPVSVDHRLCPEVDIVEGPMTDVCHALDWARNVLPTLTLKRSDIQADGDKVVVIGWSTGGHLAMSLGWTAPARGLKAPDAILVFYCPTDYENDWWKKPHYVWRAGPADSERPYDLWEVVRDSVITGYNVAGSRAPGGWMSTTNARARIPLHMCWSAQSLPILLGAMTLKKKAQRKRDFLIEQDARDPGASTQTPLMPPHDSHSHLPQPPAAQVAAISPFAYISAGIYHSPTYFIQGTEDEFIPWAQTQATYDVLVRQGVPAGISIVNGGGHMFEMLGLPKNDERVWGAVLDGYKFLLERIGMTWRDFS